MKKFFLIPLLALFTCVMAWATNVGTLQELKDALEAGGEITLTDNINAGTTELVSAAESTLDLNSFTLSGSQNNGNAGIIKVTGGSLVINATNGGGISAGTYEKGVCSLNAILVTGGSLTINAGTFVGSYEAIYATGGVVNLNGGTYSSSNDNAVWAKGATLNITDGIYDGSWYDVQVDAGATGSISGGTFKGDNDGSIAVGVAGACGKSFVVTGGTFNGNGIRSDNKKNFSIIGGRYASNPSSFIPDTYLVVLDGEYFTPTLIELIDETLVAYNISSCKTYTSLETAIDEAANSQKIKLLQNVDDTPISVAKNIVIILNGKSHNLTANEAEGYYLIANSKTLSFTNAVIHLDYAGSETQVFHSLQAAFNALPENSTPAKVTLYSDVDVDYEGKCLSVAAYQRVTLELNGHGIYGTTDEATASVVIENKGNLTIDDAVGTGIITNLSSNPDVSWSAEDETHPYPTYANNVINNRGNGVLTINGGQIKNETPGAAVYPIDMYDNSTLIINGGHIYNFFCPAIRFFGSSNAAHSQNVTINGGLVEGYSPIWMQAPTQNKAPYMNLKIAGGEIRTTAKCYAQGTCGLFDAPDRLYCSGNGTCDNTTVTIIGGVVNANIEIYKNGRLSISGGRINGHLDINKGGCSIDGGEFDFNGCSAAKLEEKYNYDKDFIASGYVFKYIGSTPENEEEDPIYEVVPAHSQAVTESKTMEQIADEIETAGEDVSASIIEINAAADKEKAVVTVAEDIAVEGIVIKKDNNKEGQIVVESGVTLTVGNSGIVSENNELTTVVVKPGGTVVVGNGGVDQQGTATPVEIQSSDTESGVFMVDPNASAEVAEAPAKVKVYTRAYKDGDIEHWQHIASPVKGQMSITPLNIAAEDQLYTIMYGWNANEGSWELLQNLPTIGGAKAFDKAGWTGNNLLTPFAAYDLINNSPSSVGGITYEFAGELVGNNDLILNFPKNGFCLFGNSYTAPIDLNTLFEKIVNDMSTSLDLATSAIDPCVYVFNSEANRFESVNSLDLLLDQFGLPAAFTQIPPQQAFVMNLLKGTSGQSSISYATSVWGNPNVNKNTPIMAPKRQQEIMFPALLNISVTNGNATDRVILVQDDRYSNEYDLGADAMKYMNGSFNLYANTAIGQLDKVATDDIENTELSFKSGNEVSYTMTFNNVIGDYVLVDRANNNQIAIEEGGIYAFAAQPNATAEGRFAIVPAAKMPTAIENTGVKTNAKGIYTIMGQYLGENFDILPAGVYVIDGVKIVK